MASELTRLQRAAYSVEARIIGDERIPALHETVQDVASAPLSWRLAYAHQDGSGTGEEDSSRAGQTDGSEAAWGGRLGALLGAVAVAEGSEPGGRRVLDVDRLVVDPSQHRRGVGMALMAEVLAEAGGADADVVVSTALANAPALRLYDVLGFRPVRDSEVVPGLWVRHLTWRQRAAVRVLCFDDAGHVLLLGWRDPHDGHLLWEPPGGGVEPGETPRDAACRELAEETGLTASSWTRSFRVARDQWWNGRRHIAVETFFLARVSGVQPAIHQGGLRADEVPNAHGHRWVGLDDLDGLDGSLEPPTLGAVARQALVGDAQVRDAPPGR